MLNRKIDAFSADVQEDLDDIIDPLYDMCLYWHVEDALIGRSDLAIFAWEPVDCV